jgi:exopolysaccharide biosynthesis polyprenyl glycosylphosphotransferase
MLFMGLVGNGADAIARVRGSRKLIADALDAAPTEGRARTGRQRHEFGSRSYVRNPERPASAERDLAARLVRGVSETQSMADRLLQRSRYEARKVQAVWAENGVAVCKRMIDVLASSLALVLLSPLFLLIAVLVKLEDGGPVFFAQTRVGRYGKQFKMYKIRSMCLDAEKRLQEILAMNQHKEGVTFKLKNDPRITRVGKWLRKLSLDELPQLYNVLVGNMSLVGPRPPVPREVAQYSLADRRRLAIKPGITCIWQISGRSEIDFSGQVRLDVDYIRNQCLWMDLVILMRTLPAVISGRGAC